MVRKLAVFVAFCSLYALGQLFPPSYSAPGGGSVTYPITAPQGGSGVVSPSANCVLTGEGASPFGTQCPNTPGYVLTDNGTGSDPTMQPAWQFVDITASSATFSWPTLTASSITAYIDFIPTLLLQGIALPDGIEDGQILTLVCNTSMANTTRTWTISADFDQFSVIFAGGDNVASYDLGKTEVDVTGTSCSVVLMWSNVNGWWEPINLYGATTL